MDEEQRLVEAARAGDRCAVDDLMRRHVSALRAFVRLNAGAKLTQREAHSDLVQSICREILQNLGGVEWQGSAAFRAWLFQTARSKIIDRARFWESQKRTPAREVALADDSDANDVDNVVARDLLGHYATFCTPSQDAILHEEQERIERAFAELPESYREVISLARIAGLPHKEIATRMGKNENAVRQLLFRALAHLALLLDPQQGSQQRPGTTA